eukprot:NODE_599_length_2037_cov_21.849738_g557_i0.p1 GENE.NODE_599_length_2037_cov_21.849738_g557_i0~~NODE_599_length_2037_cov_21.849738_g557_i0.p1  ORF type:complete len:432 (-),score=132.99 NODE_599_length_2037_cov_21.849738_g557_i0:117-1412(-)
MARLVLISHQLGQQTASQTMLAKLRTYVSVWLDQKSKNVLVYDASWGGIVSCGCMYRWVDKKPKCVNVNDDDPSVLDCPTLSDPGMDFGNAFYNDHHFHYGYHIYAAAVVAKFDKDWAVKYNEKVLTLIRDIANPSPEDPYFSPFRYFDWYEGHSWALGIVSDPNGKNQESTSEAVNAWYGMYLYGVATQNQPLRDLGETLLLSEVHSTNYYWHVIPRTNEIYPKKYDHTIVGILHDLLVEFQTYFGQQGFFVHGIQLLPITPVVHLMFDPFWVASAYPKFQQYCQAEPMCVQSGFVTFLYAEQAMIDREAAWSNAMALKDDVFTIDCAGGNGNSRTNTLYFIASWGNHPQPHWPNDMRQSQCPTAIAVQPVRAPGTPHPDADKPSGVGLWWVLFGALVVVSISAGLGWFIAKRKPGQEQEQDKQALVADA